MKLPTHWTTKDKGVIAITEMSDAHLANALKLVERRIETTDEARDACYGHGFNGEMAGYYAEQEASMCETHLSALRLAERALSSEQQHRQSILR